jgi:hypothetical protein
MKGRHYAEEEDEDDERYVKLAGTRQYVLLCYAALLLLCAGHPLTCTTFLMQI